MMASLMHQDAPQLVRLVHLVLFSKDELDLGLNPTRPQTLLMGVPMVHLEATMETSPMTRLLFRVLMDCPSHQVAWQ